jgi:alpha-beta hydrolase superfamily lysophospholipase
MIQMADVKAFRCLNKNLPIRFFSGEDDPCTGGSKGIADSIARLSRAGYIDITSKVYPHMRHEILQEKEKETVYKDMADWVLAETAEK